MNECPFVHRMDYECAAAAVLPPVSDSAPLKLFAARPSAECRCPRCSPGGVTDFPFLLKTNNKHSGRPTPPHGFIPGTKIVPPSVCCPCVFLSPGDGAAAVGTGPRALAMLFSRSHVFGMDRFSPQTHNRPLSTETTGRMGREGMVSDGTKFLRNVNGLCPKFLKLFSAPFTQKSAL